MKARVRVFDRATNKQKQMAKDLIKEELQRQAKGNMRRIFKLLCLCLNEEYGFGKHRLSNVIHKVSKLTEEKEYDEVFWTHVDQRMAQIGMEFANENYDEVDG